MSLAMSCTLGLVLSVLALIAVVNTVCKVKRHHPICQTVTVFGALSLQYCLLECVLCALIEIKAQMSTRAIVLLAATLLIIVVMCALMYFCKLRHLFLVSKLDGAKVQIEREHEQKSRSLTVHSFFYAKKLTVTSILFIFAFVLRAFAFCIALVYLGSSASFPAQIWTSLFATEALLALTLHQARQFWIEKATQCQHILNEATIILSLVLCLGFSEFTNSIDDREHLSLVFIGILLANMALNLLFVAF